MSSTTRVDFHCHSTHSDGALEPRELAAQLAADGVGFASLTDHDSLEGLDAFRHAASRRDLGTISGIELTVQCEGDEAHLLAYGFDPNHAEFRASVLSLRLARARTAQSRGESIGSRNSFGHVDPAANASAARNGKLQIGEAVELIHRAGGRAFLAHPLVLRPDPEALRVLLTQLKQDGLDGIEAIYGPYPQEQRDTLCEIAEDLDLLVSAGSDAHDEIGYDPAGLGVEMPTELWKRFRDAVCCGPETAHWGIMPAAPAPPRHRLRRRHVLLHVVFPTVLSIVLFAVAIFGVFLPSFERSLLERKRETIRELTNSAWSILATYERNERAGILTRSQAQRLAASRVEALRYGRESKDYFWLQDMQPRIIMHPYRQDLNGEDVSQFRDANGKRIFVEFADLVSRDGEGYIDYVWQWKDNPERLAPKESYIKGFKPWGWIIGTGIYTQDVHQEIARVERSLLYASLGICLVVALLLLYVMRHAFGLDRDRLDAEEGLRESTDRYRSLVEATTEGTLLVIDGRCRYANPILLGLIGCSEHELGLLDLEDIVPPGGGNELAWENISRLLAGEEPPGGFDGLLRRRDGTLVECVFALSRISFTGRSGLILLATPVGITSGPAGANGVSPARRATLLESISEEVPAGLFRARATAQGAIVECSRSAARLLGPAGSTGPGAPLTLSAFFQEPGAYESFLAEVQRDGQAECHVHLSTDAPSTQTIAIRAVLARDDEGRPRFIDGFVEDVTLQEKQSTERDAMIERLQASVLFLHEPVRHIARSALFCRLDDSVRTVAAMMTANKSGAVLVQAESGDVVGIFTDRDLRERVVAANADLNQPIRKVMSAPLVTVPEHAETYEALLAMEGKGVQHLAIEDHAGRIVGVIRGQELMQFPNYGPIVLTREISQATSSSKVVAACRRAPALAKVLTDSGAHPERVTRMLTAACDAATERFVALAQEELGPAPAPFVFVGLGSQGREEQMPSSDQDNALIYEDDGTNSQELARYFPDLGRLVCGWLDEAGYPRCKGDVMAQNPKWCKPLAVWKQYFSEWIGKAESLELLEFSIFFDFRAVCGKSELANELRQHVWQVLDKRPAFFLYLAQNSVQYKPPMRLFGRILASAGGGEHPGLLDVKDALAPIVHFARLYGLRQRLEQTHTLDRLNALADAGVLPSVSRDETVAAYEFLMRLRLEHQAAGLDSGQAPDNLIDHRRLGQLEETLLNQAFAQIAAVQKRISHDFGATA